jgi:phosphatidylinositol alpha-mannosyltransferase
VVLLEAMASGKAIVASDINGYRLVMDHGKHGFLVPEGNAGAFAESLLKLLQDGDLRRRMGQAGRRTVLEKYSWDLVAQRVEEYYLELLGAGQLLAEDLAPAVGHAGLASEAEIFVLND